MEVSCEQGARSSHYILAIYMPHIDGVAEGGHCRDRNSGLLDSRGVRPATSRSWLHWGGGGVEGRLVASGHHT